MVRVSELSDTCVENIEDVINVGDDLSVMVVEVDRAGRINLSRKAILEGRTMEDLRKEHDLRQERSLPSHDVGSSRSGTTTRAPLGR